MSSQPKSGLFHNPYHFVPLPDSPGGPERVPISRDDRGSITSLPEHATHDRYVAGCQSGTIHCRLTTETPTVAGNLHHGEEPTVVKPFFLPGTTTPGISRSALRGMISNVAEIASISAFRVFGDPVDRTFSFRMRVEDALEEIGLLVTNPRTQETEIYPLSAPIKFKGRLDRIFKNFVKNGPYYAWREGSRRPEPWDPNIHDEGKAQRGILRLKRGLAKNNLFFPFESRDEALIKDGSQNLPIAPEAFERFESLKKESKQRQKNEKIVFYRISDQGLVIEVSPSSIWRRRIEKCEPDGSLSAAKLSDLIARHDPSLLPIGYPQKTELTPAELLFGFVDPLKKKAPDHDQERETSPKLAGRVRFSHASPENHELKLETNVLLKILDSPKPPAGSFYFRSKSENGDTSKTSLSYDRHRIHGRKRYLHTELEHARQTIPVDDDRWKTASPEDRNRLKQKMKVTPIPAGEKFTFQIKFDNLTDFELGMLLYSLRPTEAFRHKLGLGKPLGLGTVEVEVARLSLIDRQARYTGKMSHASEVQPDELVVRFRALCEKSAGSAKHLDVLELLGDPASVKHPVHYPQIPGSCRGEERFEKEHFRWFSANDRSKSPQKLTPVAKKIPALKR